MTKKRLHGMACLLGVCLGWTIAAGQTTAPATSSAGPVVRVACVGDSITFGVGARERETGAYPSWLQGMLGARYEVRNFGVSGATALANGNFPYVKQKAYADALAYVPDVVVVMLGTNDSKHAAEGYMQPGEKVPENWRLKGEFEGDVAAMLEAFKKANPKVKLYACTPVPAYPGRWGINDATIREEVGPMVREVGAKEGADVIDLYAALSGKPELFPDTVHPSAGGAKLMAEAVYRSLTGREKKAEDGTVRLLLNRRVMVLGDSITQDGKWVSFVEYYLERMYPDAGVDIVSVGLASETWSGLSEKTHPFPRPCVLDRVGSALEKVRPATVIACYGMNDGIYWPESKERTEAYQAGARAVIRACRLARADVVVCTSPPFEAAAVKSLLPADALDFSYAKPFAGYDAVIADYAKWEVASLPEARAVVDFHSAVEAYVTERRKAEPDFKLTKDGLHPGPLGHLLMARVFLTQMGVELPLVDLDGELKRIQADPLFALVSKRREARSNGWLSYIGYDRGKHVKTESVDEVEREARISSEKIDALRGARSSSR